jgi:hypothetical protein
VRVVHNVSVSVMCVLLSFGRGGGRERESCNANILIGTQELED